MTECMQCGEPATETVQDGDGYRVGEGVHRYVPDTCWNAPVCASCHKPENLEPETITKEMQERGEANMKTHDFDLAYARCTQCDCRVWHGREAPCR